MLTTDSALVSAQEPAFEKRGDTVRARQYSVGRLSAAKEDSSVVAIAEIGQAAVALEPIWGHSSIG